MEIILIVAVVAVIGAVVYYNRKAKGLDVNADGKVDVADVKQAVDNAVVGVKEAVKETADVNKDGKVDVADAKVVAEVVKTKAKTVANKAKTAVKQKAKKPSAPK